MTYFIENADSAGPLKYHEISTFFQSSPNFIKLAVHIYWNHHQKHACEIWAFSEKLTYFIEKCWQCRPFEISWNFNIFSKFTKFHQTCRIYWNHHQKHACEIWARSEKLYFSQKNADSAGPRNIMKISTFIQCSQNFIKMQNLLESSSETCMWNLSPFREVIFLHRKMLTVQALEISWNFNIFSKFIKFHQTCSIYLLESSSETCMWNLSLFREVDLFHRKCWQCRPFEISWNFNIFSKFTKFHQTCRTYLNHHQKHACEIWARSEKLYFSQKNADSAGPRNIMKISTFIQCSQNYIKMQNLLESSSETCMWNLSPFREVIFFHRKMLTVQALEISWNLTFFQSSSNLIKLAEHIGIIIRNMHVKFEPFQRSWLIS